MNTSPARPWYVLVIVVILVIDGTNAAAQVIMRLLGGSTDPSALVVWQACVAATAWGAAWAASRRWRAASGLVTLHGLVLTVMLLRLPAMLELEAEAIAPLKVAAAMVFVFVLLLAAVLEREARRR